MDDLSKIPDDLLQSNLPLAVMEKSDTGSRNLLYVGLILLFFGISGEWRATSKVGQLSIDYVNDTANNGVDTHRQCNNLIYTSNFVKNVHDTAAVQWRRSIMVAFFSMIIAIPISGLKPTYRQLDLLILVVFMTAWCVAGFQDYHLRLISDNAVAVTMQNTASTYTGDDYLCTIAAT